MDHLAYRLELEGELIDRGAHGFDAVNLTYERGRTVLVGSVRDQAELQGLLQRVSSCGLTLVSFRTFDERRQH
jgi:hypothetical protein